jgi:hypothetical protein
MKVKLTVDATKEGLRATILEQPAQGASVAALAPEPFMVARVEDAKKRASAVARLHGLAQYSFIDRTKRKAKA